MRRSLVCPLLGVTLLACATEVNEFTPSALTSGGDDAGGSFAEGGRAGSMNGGRSGAFGHGGALSAGSSSGGTFGSSGSTSFAGTFGTAGMTAMGGGGAGNAGSGGKAGGGAGMGGKASGGTGGGAGSTQCTGVVIPAKNTWKATALRAAAGDPPERAIDGDDATRFSTGAPQAGDEWLQIDFGASITLNEVTLQTSNNDYFRHYQLRVSGKSEDFAAQVLKEADGATGAITVTLPQTHKGQYLTIRQTGKVTPTWWSLFEVSVACK
jgi:hypothetical protein